MSWGQALSILDACPFQPFSGFLKDPGADIVKIDLTFSHQIGGESQSFPSGTAAVIQYEIAWFRLDQAGYDLAPFILDLEETGFKFREGEEGNPFFDLDAGWREFTWRCIL